MANRKAQAITVAALLLAVGLGLSRKTGTRPADAQEPQDAVYRMFDAARAGQVDRYLSSYSGSMESALRKIADESGEGGFGRYLKDSQSAVKGLTVFDPEPLDATQVKVRVEYVYQDRNEAQTMCLEKTGAGWKITRVDSEERVKTLIPYGTPVSSRK